MLFRKSRLALAPDPVNGSVVMAHFPRDIAVLLGHRAVELVAKISTLKIELVQLEAFLVQPAGDPVARVGDQF